MKKGDFSSVSGRYGQNVTIYTQAAPEGIATRAFFQAIRERGTEQTVPSPMGWVNQDRFLYLGPAHIALEDACRVEVWGEVYRAVSVQPIYIGDTLSHWWAVFTRREREVVE